MKTRLTAASLPFKGQVTEQTTVKWPIHVSGYTAILANKVLYLLTTTLRNAFVGPGISSRSLNLPFVRVYCIVVLAAITFWTCGLLPPPTKCVPLSA